MKKYINKCKCGSIKFIVNEGLSHDADLLGEILEVSKNTGNEVENIICKECNKEYSVEDFKEIVFNW